MYISHIYQIMRVDKMKHKIFCPIGFGDCPDCEYYQAGYCEYKEDESNGKEQ